MHKNKKSKKNNDDQLRKILDNISVDDLSSDEKKYLSSLGKRVDKKSSRDAVQYKKVLKVEPDEEVDPLKPRVVIHSRAKQRSYKPVEIKKCVPDVPKPVQQEVLPEILDKKEDLYEVEKVEISEPEFIEVKPKETVKIEKDEIKEEKDVAPEWEPIEEISKVEEDKSEEPVKTEEEEIEKEIDEAPEWEPVQEEKIEKEIPKIEEDASEEPVKTEEEQIEKEIDEAPEWKPVEEDKIEEEIPKIEEDASEEPVKTEEEQIEKEIDEAPEWEPVQEEIPKIEEDKIEEEIPNVEEEKPEGTSKVEEDKIEEEIPKAEEDKQEELSQVEEKIEKTGEIKEEEISEWEPIEMEGVKKDLSKINVCAHCGKKFEEDFDNFCSGCGHKLDVKDEKEEIKDRKKGKKKVKSIPSFIPVKKIDKKADAPEQEKVLDEQLEKEIAETKDFEQEEIKDKIEKEEKVVKKSTERKKIKIRRRAKKDKKLKEENDLASEREPVKELVVKKEDAAKEIKGVKSKEIKEKISLKQKKKVDAFKDIGCIDEKTAILFYDTGFTCVDDLRKISLSSLKGMDGVSSKLAKRIKKEIESLDDLSLGNNNGFSEYLVDESSDKDKQGTIDKKILEAEEEFLDNDVEKEEKNVFSAVACIDEKTADLLYKNGITSVKNLRDMPIDELTKIRGIRRKIAKQIKKEIKDLPVGEDESDISFEGDDLGEWEYFDEEDLVEKKTKKPDGRQHGDFLLYEKIIKTKGNQKRTVRFFSKAEPDEGKPIKLPKGYEVKENKKTGVPYLKKKKK